MSVLTIEQVRKQLGGRDVLRGIDLHIAEGELVVLIGPSGAGKSTILRAIAGLETIDGGRILVGDKVFDDPAQGISMPTNRRGLGLVFQSYALWPHLTVFENIAYPLRARRIISGKLPELVNGALAQVGLDGFGPRHIQALSGGQQQRVALARAIVAQPSVLLLDEPLSNLDPKLRSQLRDEIRRIHDASGRTTLHVTHSRDEALALGDRIVVLRDGAIEQSGTPMEVYRHPNSRFVAEFFGFKNFLSGKVLRKEGTEALVQADGWHGAISADATAVPNLRAGDPTLIVIRKTGVQLGLSKADTLSGALATVISNQFQGEYRDYRLSLDTGESFVARTSTETDFPIGSRVALSLKPQSTFLVHEQDGHLRQEIPQASCTTR